MPAKDFVEETAASTGFERTVVEKVIMLTLILRGLREHELIGD